ncbi:acetyl esterase [Paenibacillus sophorae]|uniref:Acetyl esterase n=1 Tax=Paenibacillus sophorae TaxID=1333845 RepID=A0A1H8FBQ1_9BACL|nr:alpha/beta hydrolase [Paenibacillus sophorae]QWU13822.1 alpha/beta hydrolase [Paenibacillus sophorae]SEN28990.1 acetyl esterase [Paenibacillus sophorae]
MSLNPKLNKLLQTDFEKIYALPLDQQREWYAKSWDDCKESIVEVGSVHDLTVETSVRDTLIRVYHPKGNGPHPAFIWIHGGGFVFGNIEVYDSVCRRIVNNANCTVISIEYGLSPEHKFPLPVEECYETVKWVSDHAEELNILADKIAIGGDSVGGTLSAVISQLSRDTGEFKIIYQIIINAMLDLLGETKPKSRVDNAAGYRLTTKGIEWFVRQYLNELSEANNPLASPLLAENFGKLPAACIITSEYDPLRDEGELYAQRLSAAGVNVCLKRYDGVIHGFFNMQQTLEEARDALALVCTKLRDAFNED